MEEKMEMKNEEKKGKNFFSYPVIIMFVLLIGLCLIFSFSYAFMTPENLSGGVSLLEVSIKDNGEGITLVEANPLSDDDGSAINPYLFTVTNKSENEAKYRLLIEDLPLGEIKDGCTASTLLDRSQLRYQLKRGTDIVATGNLSDLQMNILSEGVIEGNETYEFALRVWVKMDAYDTSWTNKHYHYKVTLAS